LDSVRSTRGGKHRAQANDGLRASCRRQRGQRSIGINDQTDQVVPHGGMLCQARSNVHIMSEAIQRTGAQGARAAGVDGNDDLHALILREVAADQPAGPGCGLPVEDPWRIAGTVVAQAHHFGARPALGSCLRT
jgi:hypothetical protein